MKLAIGEIAGDHRFPTLCLTLDGKRYRIGGAAAHQFGYALMEAARLAVNRVDPEVLREAVAEVDLIEIEVP